jgi:outer membrane protein assembly factor BamD
VHLFVLFFSSFIFLLANSCSDKDFTKDPAASFAIAKEPYDDKDYDIALTKLSEYRSRFPYSQYAVEASLLIANAHFELEQFEEAASAYSQFTKLHPKHQELGYAYFRVGESYWSLSPDSIDREQEFTHKAIEEWQVLIKKLPQSSWAKKAKKLVKEGKLRIAQSFEFVSKFYCKQEIYHACAFRSVNLARLYPEFKEMRRDALVRAADALVYVAEQKKEDPKSDKNIYLNTLSSDEILALSKKLRTESRNDRAAKKTNSSNDESASEAIMED